ncbi:MAG: undecaprenyl-diphosphatase [Bradymonadia bacterium]
MNLLDAGLMGAVQALTEFLPVSSSGHLRLASAWLGVEGGHDLLFDIVLHLGTLCAVVWVYRARLFALLQDLFAGLSGMREGVPAWLRASEGARFAFLVVLATVPTGVIGILLKDLISGDTLGIRVVGGLLCVNAALLALSIKFPGGEEGAEAGPYSIGGIGPREAVLIGVIQGLAVFPGISRSGATITMALALGAYRMKAAEFSFFLSIPAIIGASLVEFDSAALAQLSGDLTPYIAGAVVSATVGVAALLGLLRLLRAAKFHHFAWYCLALGIAALLFGG